MLISTEVIIIGAGAAGLMCAIEAGKRGRSVVVLEHSRKPGNKIRMSGGGRCNFTNYNIDSENYLSQNNHFVKSALSRYSQWDFLALVQLYQIPFHEREHGQLFCDNSAKDILDMLLLECKNSGVQIRLKSNIKAVERVDTGGYKILSDTGDFVCESLVIATGGLSIPTSGATSFGYKVAQQFNLNIIPPSAGLVPFTFDLDQKSKIAELAGIAVVAEVSCNSQIFRENILFTHRGLSGPAILQISNYWEQGKEIEIDWLPDVDIEIIISEAISKSPKQLVKTALSPVLPQRLIEMLLGTECVMIPINQLTGKQVEKIVLAIKHWKVIPAGTLGYRVAEVTKGGVDCHQVSSKTMQANSQPGLFFIGEVLDVCGWLGGYNLQWAWSSGWCSGQYA